ncbi:hypothetical protein ZWY2020_041879 [Hordeum vulgare]|nr:hypothetical protein ZWY2020_041879 [Hordeum vulgare]
MSTNKGGGEKTNKGGGGGKKKKEVKKEMKLGMAYKKDDNFGEWYSQGPHSRDEALSTTSSEGSGVKAEGGPTEPASVPKA